MRPITDAWRRSSRSAGSSVSMRVVSSDSTVSGSASPSGRCDGELADEERVAGRASRSARRAARPTASSRPRRRARARGRPPASSGSSSTHRRRAAERRPGRPPRGDDEPRPRRGLRQLGEHELRRVVEPVRVLEDDRRRHHQQPHQELVEHVVQAVAAERRVDLVDLGRRCDLGVERQREERQPQSRGPASTVCTNAVSFAPAASGVVVREDPDQRPQERAERCERRRRRRTARSGRAAPGSRARSRRAPRAAASCLRRRRRRARRRGSAAAAPPRAPRAASQARPRVRRAAGAARDSSMPSATSAPTE